MHPQSVKLIWITPDAEQQLAYIARVSNPSNQDNPDASRLLKYCVSHGHWSVFEMANVCMEINTTRAISPQILRHRSFTFQEFSQRYASVDSIGQINLPALRRQDTKNRQNSIDDLDPSTVDLLNSKIQLHCHQAQDLYQQLLDQGVAKECARAILPLNTPTRLYMNGTVRSWIHYVNLRTGNGTQQEHKEIALMAKDILKAQLPSVSTALGWNDD